MSHFSRVRTTFRHREALVQCLKEMGFTVEENTTVQGHHGCHTVDIAATTKQGFGIGFVRNNDGNFDMVADWWGVKARSQTKMVEELRAQAGAIQKEYAKMLVLEQTVKDGFEVISQTEEKDGTVRIVVRRWI
jgi:hypothetical protein